MKQQHGWFWVHRTVFDHPAFAKEPYTEREAWLWLISSAAWTDRRIRVGKSVVDLKRGQLMFAIRFLAEKWGWAPSKAYRFLRETQSEKMIETQPKRSATLITICNYDKYQFTPFVGETQSETPIETEMKRKRDKEEEINNKLNTKKERKDSSSNRVNGHLPPVLSIIMNGWPDDFFDQFWKIYPKHSDKQPALKKLTQIRNSGAVLWKDLIDGVQRYADSRRGQDEKYTKGPAAWLNAGKWEDEVSVVQATPKEDLPAGWIRA